MTRIAITGGKGTIGKALVALALAKGYDVITLDRTAPPDEKAQPGLQEIQLELADYEATEVALRGADALIHLAAIPAPGLAADHIVHNNNVTSSYNVLAAAARLNIKRVCMASSINATGAGYSRRPRYNYFPLDEQHPTYNEDPYSLSKWIAEQQADSFARRHEEMTIASVRIHWVTAKRIIKPALDEAYTQKRSKDLWGYTMLEAVARACLLSISASFKGHEVFYTVAPDTTTEMPSRKLKRLYYNEVPLRSDLQGNSGFYDCSKAQRMLGWSHDVR